MSVNGGLNQVLFVDLKNRCFQKYSLAWWNAPYLYKNVKEREIIHVHLTHLLKTVLDHDVRVDIAELS